MHPKLYIQTSNIVLLSKSTSIRIHPFDNTCWYCHLIIISFEEYYHIELRFFEPCPFLCICWNTNHIGLEEEQNHGWQIASTCNPCAELNNFFGAKKCFHLSHIRPGCYTLVDLVYRSSLVPQFIDQTLRYSLVWFVLKTDTKKKKDIIFYGCLQTIQILIIKLLIEFESL